MDQVVKFRISFLEADIQFFYPLTGIILRKTGHRLYAEMKKNTLPKINVGWRQRVSRKNVSSG
jgi:hypothetical protein